MTGRVRSVTGHERAAGLALAGRARRRRGRCRSGALAALGIGVDRRRRAHDGGGGAARGGRLEPRRRRRGASTPRTGGFARRCPTVARADGDELALRLDGLATVADVWLNGAPLLVERQHVRRARARRSQRGGGELVIRCRALDARARRQAAAPALARADDREPAAALVSHHAARAHARLVAAGRGGRAVARRCALERRARRRRRRRAAARGRCATASGASRSRAALRALGARRIGPAALVVARGGADAPRRARRAAPATCCRAGSSCAIRRAGGRTRTASRRCYDARLELGGVDGRRSARSASASVDAAPSDVRARGQRRARLLPRRLLDAARPGHARARPRGAARRRSAQVRDAGMNMLRVGGTMVYESDDFYDAVRRARHPRLAGLHVRQHGLPRGRRRRSSPSVDGRGARSSSRGCRRARALAVLCGNSEGEQQAAMWGAAARALEPAAVPRDAAVAGARAAARTCPTGRRARTAARSRTRATSGTTSYYGVGAYLRPLDDARRAEVRFASECLAFANVPEPRALPGGPSVRVHHPAWKARTPRDLGAGWDFDDVRDHYLGELFGVDPMRAALRRSRALPRARPRRHRRGDGADVRRVAHAALDLRAAAWSGSCATCGRRRLGRGRRGGRAEGGRGTTCKRALRRSPRTSATRAATGSSSTWSTIAPTPLDGRARARRSTTPARSQVASARRAIAVGPRATIELGAATLFDGFLDLSYAYRFGPPSHDLVVATLRAPSGATLAQAFHFPLGLPATRELDVGLTARAPPSTATAPPSRVRTRRFAQSVAVEADGFVADDDYFHLPPGGERTLRLRRVAGATSPLRGTLQPLNAEPLDQDRRHMTPDRTSRSTSGPPSARSSAGCTARPGRRRSASWSCNPFGYEAICAHRSLRHFARGGGGGRHPGAALRLRRHRRLGRRRPRARRAWRRGSRACTTPPTWCGASAGVERVAFLGVRLGALAGRARRRASATTSTG